ncbi:hypothetical protein TPL01_20770 [Sulfuriferula plumbiphila]|uniref:Uncharacterized protein n=1 Tax=Sulfuriferula plumbiphila TaxID=171865 RepID=A0A512L8Y5_9PROT|nr:hypothetical protein [Sulfuriferula plumbiphila]BBP04231.1 hypothetical protein SFPGR_16530 [Sulfuriferula plumbiphila]GEP30939.1 hypothetical protein TPL01_20770 [Sulfuriferula plumbiphila]
MLEAPSSPVLTFESARDYGDVWALTELWNSLGFDRLRQIFRRTRLPAPGKTAAVPAGNLVLEEAEPESTASRFGYGRRYLARPNAVPVAPLSLPFTCLPGDQATYEPVNPPLFGAVRDAALDFWGRRVLETKLKVPPDSVPESVYLLNAGPNRFGALDFRPEMESPEAPAFRRRRSLPCSGSCCSPQPLVAECVPVPEL